MGILPVNRPIVSLAFIQEGGLTTSIAFQSIQGKVLVENALIQQAEGNLNTLSLLDCAGEEVLRFREPDAVRGKEIQIGRAREGGPILITEASLSEHLGMRIRKSKQGAETVFEIVTLERGVWVARRLQFGETISIGEGYSLRLNAAKTVGQVDARQAFLNDLGMLSNQPLTPEVVQRMERVLGMVALGGLNSNDAVLVAQVRTTIAKWKAAQEPTQQIHFKTKPRLLKVVGLRLGDDYIRLQPGEKLTVGRERWNGAKHLILDKGGVSRRHAVIERKKTGHFYIKDLGSTNGTSLNGESLIEGREYEISDGDALVMGGVYLDVVFFEAHQDPTAEIPLDTLFPSVIIDPSAFVPESPEKRVYPPTGVTRLLGRFRDLFRRQK